MRFFSILVTALALAVPAPLAAQAGGQAPACRGSLEGDRLTTTIIFPNGYTVEGPWRVSGNRPVALEDGTRGVAMNASLDRIIEVEPGTGQRVTTPFPEPIETTFDGENEQQLVERAAQIWCLTVIRAQQNHQRNQSQRANPGR
jgi:hypothetical protein